jgi:hypothetical protein
MSLAHVIPRPQAGESLRAGEPTGFAALDTVLPTGGWPRGALTELIFERPGIGEISLIAPALARVSETSGVALVGAPFQACAPGWAQHRILLSQLLLVNATDAADKLWAAGQSLRSGAFGAVLLWASGSLHDRDLRRLQLAAEDGKALAFLFRGPMAARQASPAALRMKLSAAPSGSGLAIDILKCRGGAPRSLQLALPGRAGRRDTGAHSNVVAMPLPAARGAR